MFLMRTKRPKHSETLLLHPKQVLRPMEIPFRMEGLHFGLFRIKKIDQKQKKRSRHTKIRRLYGMLRMNPAETGVVRKMGLTCRVKAHLKKPEHPLPPPTPPQRKQQPTPKSQISYGSDVDAEQTEHSKTPHTSPPSETDAASDGDSVSDGGATFRIVPDQENRSETQKAKPSHEDKTLVWDVTDNSAETGVVRKIGLTCRVKATLLDRGRMGPTVRARRRIFLDTVPAAAPAPKGGDVP